MVYIACRKLIGVRFMKCFKLVLLIIISALTMSFDVFATGSDSAQNTGKVAAEKNAAGGNSNETANETLSNETLKEPAEFQQVIDEYRKYVATIPVDTRDEVIAYRKEMAKLNKEKRLLFQKLSDKAKDYLKEEQKFKKKLPLNHKGRINVETPGKKAEN